MAKIQAFLCKINKKVQREYNDWKEKLFESDLFELNWHTLS